MRNVADLCASGYRLGALVIGLLALGAARVDAAIISDTQHMVDYSGATFSRVDFALFDFTGQTQLSRIHTLTINLAIEDGDTALGDFDFNNLTLGLDTINTGVLLNGFPDGIFPGGIPFVATDSPFTFTATLTQTLSDTILAAMSDGQLVASILDATEGTGDCECDPNNPRNFINLYSVFRTTLTFTGDGGDPVPEPTTMALWALGVAGGYIGHRRYRKQKASA